MLATGLQQKASRYRFFVIFYAKMCKNGVPNGGGIAPRIGLFFIGLTLGSPGEPKATITEPWGAKMLSRAPQIEVLGSKTVPKRTQ